MTRKQIAAIKAARKAYAAEKKVVVDRATELKEILPYPYNTPGMIKRIMSSVMSSDELWFAAGMENRPSFNEISVSERFDLYKVWENAKANDAKVRKEDIPARLRTAFAEIEADPESAWKRVRLDQAGNVDPFGFGLIPNKLNASSYSTPRALYEHQFVDDEKEPTEAFRGHMSNLLASCDGIWSDGNTMHIVMPEGPSKIEDGVK